MAVESMGDPDAKNTAEAVDSSDDSQGHLDSDHSMLLFPSITPQTVDEYVG